MVRSVLRPQVVDKLDKNTQVLLLDMHDTTEPFTDLLKAFSPDHPLVLGKEVSSNLQAESASD
jgi:hypothetical protein